MEMCSLVEPMVMGMLRARRGLVKTETGFVTGFAKVSGHAICRFGYIQNGSELNEQFPDHPNPER
jgi:hypothetical protein